MRTIIFLIAIGVVIWLISRMLKNKLSQNQQSNDPRSSEIKNIVQCQQCKAFIPEDKAIRENNRIFCSQKHLEEWKDTE